jgi:hypothetical protein
MTRHAGSLLLPSLPRLSAVNFFLRGEIPLPGHVIIAIFIQFPTREELVIFAVSQGFIIL